MNNSTTNGSLEPFPLWSVILFDVLMGATMIVGLAGNAVVLLVKAFSTRITSTDWLVIALSANDIIIAGFTIPVDILFFNGAWPEVGSDALCRIHYYLRESFSYCVTLLLSLTAIDRYIKTCRPYAIGVTPTRAKWICVSIFMATFIMNLPILFTFKYDEFKQCKMYSSALLYDIVLGLTVFIMVTFFIMFVTVTICYAKIAYVIRTKLLKSTQMTLGERNTSKSTIRAGPSQSSSKTTSDKNNLKETAVSKPKPGVFAIAEDTQRDTHCSTSIDGDGHDSGEATFSHAFSNDSNKRKHSNSRHCERAGNRKRKRTTCTNPERRRTKRETSDWSQSMTFQQTSLNRTTLIMFLVTLVFILSWIPPWIAWAISAMGGNTLMDRIIIKFARRAFVINSVTNPLFYISMSTAFRSTAKTMVRHFADKIRIRA